jgi:hypothetical protein
MHTLCLMLGQELVSLRPLNTLRKRFRPWMDQRISVAGTYRGRYRTIKSDTCPARINRALPLAMTQAEVKLGLYVCVISQRWDAPIRTIA